MPRLCAPPMRPAHCSPKQSPMTWARWVPISRRSKSRTPARSSPAICANTSGRKASRSIFRFRRKATIMYAYDELDRTIINERVSEFRDQVKRRLSGELTEDEFKMLRLQNGVYLQLHAYMFRVAIPYGTLSSKQLRRLAHVARRYDRGYGHFTTRQNIQFNWIKLAELPDALADLADVGIHAMQTSGNNTRNVTSDQWAGVAPGEIEDPRIWSEILRQYTTLHPEFSFLPRKFKFAITASAHDRAAIKVHDIGLRLYRNEAGETGFEVLVGGGLGRTPFIGKTIKPFVHGHDLLSYVEAILRVYNQYGRRDNIYKARIKILVHELGIEKFAREVEEEWLQMRDSALAIDDSVIEDLRSRFSYPAYEKLPHMPEELKKAAHDPHFEAWRKNSVFPHKVPGYAIVTLSLKPVGGPPGDATADQMDAIADLADKYSFGEIRVGHEQNLVLPHVARRDLPALWRALDPDRAGSDAALCQSRHRQADRAAARQYFRLHQRLRPSSRRPHRHPGRREERRGILSDHDRRPRRRKRRGRQLDRAGGALWRSRRCGRGYCRGLSRAARAAGRTFHRCRQAAWRRTFQGARLCHSLKTEKSPATLSSMSRTMLRFRAMARF